MTAIEQIRNYLNNSGANYIEGISILQSFGNKPHTCTLLLQHQDKAKLNRLLNALFDELNSKEQSSPKEIVIEATPQSTNIPQPRLKTLAATKLYDRLKSGIKQIDSIKQNIFYIGRDTATGKPLQLSQEQKQQRFELAKLLCGSKGLNKETIDVMEDLRYLQLYGISRPKEKPQPKAEPSAAITDDYRAKENMRKLIAKLKSKIANEKNELPNLSDSDKIKSLNNISKWENQLTATQHQYGK